MTAPLTAEEEEWLKEKGSVTEILHKSYFGGMVQSLRGVMPDGTVFTDGHIMPRFQMYDFGVAEHEEHITVTLGGLNINGKWYSVGETAVVKKGKQIFISCPALCTYRCVYR